MKTKYFCLFLFLLPVIGCDHEAALNPDIELVDSSVCKKQGLKANADQSSDQDCIRYTWLAGDTLSIRHVNAGFNCCPQGFKVELGVVGDTLIITEAENSSMCDCSCLFDLDYILTGISKDTWFIKVVEPYVQQSEQKKILFKIELKKDTEGEVCITRTGYPWGT